ncbi:tRNA1(Val) (adenine(37)-N6)-methyltransferase [Eudoraea sp.]|uniref:tRNA1(Val) (adenine(37)-N6)-methyltransferase n=1 Tax=Eudoraea sp. TaxID=1979955 RepID=UPI003C722AAC
MRKPFKFKQFTIYQDRCAMKIGTDGVLLGAWTNISNSPESVLDIGAGTGIIGLMLAQRCYANTIDAIEIDEDAFEQCVENFEASPWSDRLFCYHASLDEFLDEIDDKYDLIISNPPFYSEQVTSGNIARDQARQNSSLPFNLLLKGVSELLSKNGSFAIVVPFKEEKSILQQARKFELYPVRLLRVKGHPDSEVKRSLIEFHFKKTEVLTNELIIEKSRHEFTEDYINLTKDFYLKM